MDRTAVGGDYFESANTGCWCCGDRSVDASLLSGRVHHAVHYRVGTAPVLLLGLVGLVRAVNVTEDP